MASEVSAYLDTDVDRCLMRFLVAQVIHCQIAHCGESLCPGYAVAIESDGATVVVCVPCYERAKGHWLSEYRVLDGRSLFAVP